MLDYLNEGGWAMYVILGLSVCAVAIMIERFAVLTLSYRYRAGFFEDILHHIKAGKLRSAVGLCYRTGHPLAGVIIDLLKNHKRDNEAIESAAYIAMEKIIPHLQKRTNYLQMLGNVSTLIGLLGTIGGLMMSFSSLATADPAQKAELLAAGISTAMLTTAFGLIVAVPCIIAFTVLSNKENAIIQKYESTVNEIIHIMSHDWKAQQESANMQAQQQGAGNPQNKDNSLIEIG